MSLPFHLVDPCRTAVSLRRERHCGPGHLATISMIPLKRTTSSSSSAPPLSSPAACCPLCRVKLSPTTTPRLGDWLSCKAHQIKVDIWLTYVSFSARSGGEPSSGVRASESGGGGKCERAEDVGAKGGCGRGTKGGRAACVCSHQLYSLCAKVQWKAKAHHTAHLAILRNGHHYPVIKCLDEQLSLDVAYELAKLERRYGRN